MIAKISMWNRRHAVSPVIAAIMMIGHSIRETYIIRNIPETYIIKETGGENKKMEMEKSIAKRVISVTIVMTFLITVLTVLPMTAVAAGTAYDLTTDPTGLGNVTINGAIWSIYQPTDPTGSGVFHAFFREEAHGNERGYNTDGRPLQFDEKKSLSFTHAVYLADVPIVTVNGTLYREFQLDINEKKSDPDWYLSLDEFQVWTTNDQNLTGYVEGTVDGTGGGYFPDGNGTGQAKLVYNLDGAGDSWIKMDFRANPGSGKRDYKVQVPQDYFVGKNLIYSMIFARHGLEGGDWISDDGYEEWGVEIYPTEPDTLVTIETSANESGDVIYAGETVNLTVTETNTGTANLHNVSVVVYDGSTDIAVLNETDPTWDDGSGSGDAVLDIGETWSWTIYNVQVDVDTTFTATGYGETMGGDPITYPEYPHEQATITVYTIAPDTQVNITASASLVYKWDVVDLYVSEYNNGDVPLQNAHVNVTGGAIPFALDNTTANESITDDDILDPGEIWTWMVSDYVITADITFTATGHGTDPMGNDITYTEGYFGELDSVAINVIAPDTLVNISASAATVYVNDTVNLTVTEKNNGDVNLTNPYVVVLKDGGAFANLDNESANFSGDDDDGILETGETWTWMVSGVVINADTTFNATGHGTDPMGNDITYTEGYFGELDSVAINVIAPDTLVNISASAATVYVNDTVNLTVTEKNNGDVNLTNPYVVVLKDGGAFANLDNESANFSGDDDDGILETGETWTWMVSGVVINADTTFNATGHGTDPLGNDITYPVYAGEHDAVSIYMIAPDTQVNISTSAETVYAGDTVNLTVTEENNGNVNLTGAYVAVDPGIGNLSAPPDSGDDGDGILEPNETWSWTVSGVVITADTTFNATGHGTDPLGNDITYPVYAGERDAVSIYTIAPDTQVNITISAETVYVNDTVNLTVTEKNNGNVNLTGAYVNVTPGGYMLNKTSGYYVEGDSNDDGALNISETWKWVITDVVINAVTNFTALGHGFDPSGNDISFANGYAGEKATVDPNVIAPDTLINISASADTVYAGDTVNLTVTEENNGNDPLVNPYVDVDQGIGILNKTSTSYTGGDTNGDGILDPGETWTWVVTGVVITADTTFNATGHGTDSLSNDVTWCLDETSPPANTVCDQDEKAEISVDVIAPNTLVNISTSAETVYAGDTVNLTVTEENNGNVNLTGAYVAVDPGIGNLSAPPDSGDNGNNILEPNETWSWTVSGVVITADTTFNATGHGTDSLGNDITYPVYAGEHDAVFINVIAPDTQTKISSSTILVYFNDTVTLTVTEKNTGDLNLTNPYVNVTPGGYTLNKTSYYAEGDSNGDGALNITETWKWVITGVVINADTTFTAFGHGFDPSGNDISFANGYAGEKATVDIDVITEAPAFTFSGLIALVSSLATIAALSIRRKRR